MFDVLGSLTPKRDKRPVAGPQRARSGRVWVQLCGRDSSKQCDELGFAHHVDPFSEAASHAAQLGDFLACEVAGLCCGVGLDRGDEVGLLHGGAELLVVHLRGGSLDPLIEGGVVVDRVGQGSEGAVIDLFLDGPVDLSDVVGVPGLEGAAGELASDVQSGGDGQEAVPSDGADFSPVDLCDEPGNGISSRDQGGVDGAAGHASGLMSLFDCGAGQVQSGENCASGQDFRADSADGGDGPGDWCKMWNQLKGSHGFNADRLASGAFVVARLTRQNYPKEDC